MTQKTFFSSPAAEDPESCVLSRCMHNARWRTQRLVPTYIIQTLSTGEGFVDQMVELITTAAAATASTWGLFQN